MAGGERAAAAAARRTAAHGRVRPGRYPLWGVTYLRVWLCAKVLALSPLGLLAGSPLLPPCLRALGARIGRGCHLSAVPGLPFLVRVGAGRASATAPGCKPSASRTAGCGWRP
ncbi:hypothetical protein NKH77_26115 [Streptomyces sp. M19]